MAPTEKDFAQTSCLELLRVQWPLKQIQCTDHKRTRAAHSCVGTILVPSRRERCSLSPFLDAVVPGLGDPQPHSQHWL